MKKKTNDPSQNGTTGDGKKKQTKVVKMKPGADQPGTEPLSTFQTPATGRQNVEHHKVKLNVPDGGKELEISKIKIRTEHFLSVEFISSYDGDKVRNPGTEECNWPVHDDLKKAMNAFRVHLACIMEYIDEKKVKGEISEYNSPIIDRFRVTQVSLSNNQDGVTITGGFYKRGGKLAPFNAPFTKFYESGDDGYKFGTDLQIAWENLVKETIDYLNGVKRGTPIQPELNFEQGGQSGNGEPPIIEEDL